MWFYVITALTGLSTKYFVDRRLLGLSISAIEFFESVLHCRHLRLARFNVLKETFIDGSSRTLVNAVVLADQAILLVIWASLLLAVRGWTTSTIPNLNLLTKSSGKRNARIKVSVILLSQIDRLCTQERCYSSVMSFKRSSHNMIHGCLSCANTFSRGYALFLWRDIYRGVLGRSLRIN